MYDTAGTTKQGLRHRDTGFVRYLLCFLELGEKDRAMIPYYSFRFLSPHGTPAAFSLSFPREQCIKKGYPDCTCPGTSCSPPVSVMPDDRSGCTTTPIPSIVSDKIRYRCQGRCGPHTQSSPITPCGRSSSRSSRTCSAQDTPILSTLYALYFSLLTRTRLVFPWSWTAKSNGGPSLHHHFDKPEPPCRRHAFCFANPGNRPHAPGHQVSPPGAVRRTFTVIRIEYYCPAERMFFFFFKRVLPYE